MEMEDSVESKPAQGCIFTEVYSGAPAALPTHPSPLPLPTPRPRRGNRASGSGTKSPGK